MFKETTTYRRSVTRKGECQSGHDIRLTQVRRNTEQQSSSSPGNHVHDELTAMSLKKQLHNGKLMMLMRRGPPDG